MHTEIPVFRWQPSPRENAHEGMAFVYNTELVRKLCWDITEAREDREKEQQLISLLQAIIKDDQEEIRVRMAFITQKYAPVIREAKTAA